uniref:Engrailed n=1 Tax=Ciona savignyi TaxID=51511 RepID=Q8MUM6_CIOSA|nr:engrailed [Ciona savignyi]
MTRNTRLPNFNIDTILRSLPLKQNSNDQKVLQEKWIYNQGVQGLHPKNVFGYDSKPKEQTLTLQSRVSYANFNLQLQLFAQSILQQWKPIIPTESRQYVSFGPSSVTADLNDRDSNRFSEQTKKRYSWSPINDALHYKTNSSKKDDTLVKAGDDPLTSLDRLSQNVECSVGNQLLSLPKLQSSPKPTELGHSCDKNDQTEEICSSAKSISEDKKTLWPAWVYCTRYSDRPSAGPRIRKAKRKHKESDTDGGEKRARTAFTPQQVNYLQQMEFEKSQYLTEDRRIRVSESLGLSVSQIKVWFQNKRAKVKKTSGVKNELAMQLLAQGLYNHRTQKHED